MDPGAALKVKRKEQGLYMWQVGQRLGVSESAICRYENGKRVIPPELLVSWALVVGARELLTDACRYCPVGQARERGESKPLETA